MWKTQIQPSAHTVEDALEHVRADLTEKYADTATPEQVAQIVRTATQELATNDRHLEFLACLVEHRARTVLHDLA
ncbi:three-helix bundle dimerization domain-containing protein [Kribbia dieselivorans]|uniref:three-helix bundle dimerization domain-containing protein n=1 Tax=Kribbia dieselivorans TaxID=331526 RepID=UPI000838B8CB|nr:hypothetical protein [Kribbia dieselivorans]